jgi:hypothetical protein
VQDRVKEDHTETVRGREKNPGPFNRLLTDHIERSRKNGDLSNKELSLDKDRLWEMIKIIQIQMNYGLFSAFVDFDEDNELYGFQNDWIKFHGTASQVESLVSRIDHAPQKTKQDESETRFGHIIDHASKTYGVDPELIKAVVRAESDFDANATSPKGAMGLMQLMPETARELGVKNCYSPVENITAGTRYLKSLLDRYDGNIPIALAAYNWGMGNVERHPEKLPRETRTYIARINEFMNEEKG